MPRRPPGSRTDSVWNRPAPATSGSVPAFSRAEITRAAIGLADEKGLEAVSMRRIAEQIGSAPTSIYWYVSDKNELYELMVDSVIGEIGLPAGPTGDWRADLSSIAWATLAAMRRHRWFSQLGIQPVPGPGTLRYATAVLRCLSGSGLDETTAISVLATLNNYTFGFIQREAAWQRLTSMAAADGIDRRPRPGDGPLSDQGLSARLRLADDASFTFGLDRFLDGIAVLIDRGAEAG